MALYVDDGLLRCSSSDQTRVILNVAGDETYKLEEVDELLSWKGTTDDDESNEDMDDDATGKTYYLTVDSDGNLLFREYSEVESCDDMCDKLNDITSKLIEVQDAISVLNDKADDEAEDTERLLTMNNGIRIRAIH